MSDYRRAWDLATREGDRHMRCYGGVAWNRDDLFAAHYELERQLGKIYSTLDDQAKGMGQAAAGNETG